MYGMNMRIEIDGFGVSLRPFCKEDIPNLVKHWNSMKIHLYTMGLFAQTLENEEEWYEKTRVDDTSISWAIVPDGSTIAVGITAIHDIDRINHSCVSGIINWDPAWWGKGVATRTHLGRTMFASDYLNRYTIKSAARVKNRGSVRALKRAGYHVVGTEPRTTFRAKGYIDTVLLVWLHPERIDLLYPEGLPKKYKRGVALAKAELERARKAVSLP